MTVPVPLMTLRTESLFGSCAITDAVVALASAGIEQRGAVFTRREVVDSYLQRYDLLCQKLVKENLYSATCTLTSQRSAATTGNFADMSELSSLKTFVTAFAGHIAAEAARS